MFFHSVHDMRKPIERFACNGYAHVLLQNVDALFFNNLMILSRWHFWEILRDFSKDNSFRLQCEWI